MPVLCACFGCNVLCEHKIVLRSLSQHKMRSYVCVISLFSPDTALSASNCVSCAVTALPIVIVVMALSKPAALNPEEAKLLRSLLARVRATGTDSDFADALQPSEFEEDSDGEFEHLTGGPVMSEATKRRMVADSAAEIDAGYGRTRACAAAPPFEVPTMRASGVPPTSTATMPADVATLEDWGSTVMEEGKFASAKMSYAEMVNSSDKAVGRYLKWLMSALTDKFKPQYHDLVAYLNAIDFGKTPAGTAGFVRNRKGK